MEENNKIVFNCPVCGKRLSVSDEHAGKQARCPNCGKRIAIPKKRDRK